MEEKKGGSVKSFFLESYKKAVRFSLPCALNFITLVLLILPLNANLYDCRQITGEVSEEDCGLPDEARKGESRHRYYGNHHRHHGCCCCNDPACHRST